MSFSINASNFSWIDGQKDDPQDLCLHGHAVVHIADCVLEYDATVSATALYLLKSITENHIIDEDIQMLPCCGHTFLANNDRSGVHIVGCPNGIDWSVTHDADTVVLELADGTKDRIPLGEYAKEIFRFADEVEGVYHAYTPKILPEDPFERDGYIAFWNEWYRRRGK